MFCRAIKLARIRLLWVCLVLLLSTYSFAADVFGPVVSVIDGDTLDVLYNNQPERIRLNGIDAPEKGQNYGRKAKQLLEELTKGQDVTVETKGLDKYGRTIGDVFLSDGRHVNKEMVKAGLAWWYCRHSSDQSLKNLEEEARDNKRGLWHTPVPIPPWVYRKLQRKQVPDVADFDCPAKAHADALAGTSQGTLPDTASASSAEGAAAVVTGEVVGNKRSHIYHRSDCPSFGKVSEGNRVSFPSVEEAEIAGYRLAGNCP